MTTSNEPELPTLRPRLLLVDDQPINIQILYQLFQDDFEIFMATDGQQALGVCERESPDLILLDVVMPEMDGLEVCRRLKASPATRAIPVIFVTGQNAPDEEAAGLEVITAVHGEEALARLRADAFDCVFMDIQMPVKDGLTAITEWRDWERSSGRVRTPVIALTANALGGERERCLAAGMDDYMAKPFQRQTLLEMVSRYLLLR